jgi:hypothetical protein
MHSARVAHAHGAGSAHAHSAGGPRSRRWRGPCAQCAAYACRAGLGLCGPRRRSAHVGAVTAPRHVSRRGQLQRHSGGGGANGGGRAPTTVRLPVGHGGGEDSSPELLVDGEGKKSGSTVVFFPSRWGYGGRWRSCDGVEGGEGELDAPRKRNDERKARATLTVDETRDGGGRPDIDEIRTWRRRGFGQRRRRGRDGARRGEAVGTAAAARSERRCAVGTPTHGPDSAFNARARHGAWQPCGNGALPGGPSADSGI